MSDHTDTYVTDAIAEILSNNPDIPSAQLDKAAAELRADNPDKRWFFTEIKRLHPEVTFHWNGDTVCLLGIRLKTPARQETTP